MPRDQDVRSRLLRCTKRCRRVAHSACCRQRPNQGRRPRHSPQVKLCAIRYARREPGAALNCAEPSSSMRTRCTPLFELRRGAAAGAAACPRRLGDAAVCRGRGREQAAGCRLPPRLGRLLLPPIEFGQQLIDARVRCVDAVLARALPVLPPSRRRRRA
jgi:hypothetical protein